MVFFYWKYKNIFKEMEELKNWKDSWDVLEKGTIEIDGKSYVKEDEAYDAVDQAMRELAWKIHVMLCERKSKNEIDKYVTDIVDF